MHKRYIHAGLRLFLAGLVITAVITQLAHLANRDTFNPANFFSFFTIESNILAAVVLIIAACYTLAGKKETTGFALVRGAATLYMVMTGIIFALLLSGIQNSLQTTIPWVNTVLHYIMPIAMLADWFSSLPRQRITFKRALIWLVFPVAYLFYSLVRGHITHWYPYPFLNPTEHGYGRVALTSVIISIGAVLLVWFLATSTLLPHKIRRRKH